MRLGQIRWNGEVTAAVFEETGARPIPEHTLYDLLQRSEKEGVSLPQLAKQHVSKPEADATTIRSNFIDCKLA